MLLKDSRGSHTDGKAHSVSNDNDSRHTIRTHLLIAIDKVVDTEGNSAGVCKGEQSHCKNKAEPVDTLGCADTPNNQRDRDDNGCNRKWPKALFGLEYSIVTSG